MKKLFLSIMTASMFFVSCSNDETVVPENNGSENNVEDLVEIKLGAGSRIGSSVTESRAVTAVESLDNLTVGLFMLEKSGNWTSLETTGARPVFWNNIDGTFTRTDSTDSSNNYFYTVNYGTTKEYYPREATTSYAYDFYAYYPKNDVVSSENDSISVTADFTGNEDIIWGKAASTDGQWNALSAKTATPNINLNHLLAWFEVEIVKGEQYDASLCRVDSLKFTHPQKYTLNIANTTSSEEGILEFSTETKATDIIDSNFGYDATASSNELGKIGDIFVQPGLDKYVMNLVLSDNTKTPVELNYSSVINGKVEAGKKYTVKISISGPTEIRATATLTEWVEGGEITGGI